MKVKNLGNAVIIDKFDISTCSIRDIHAVKQLLHKHLVVVLKKQSTDPRLFARLIDNIGEIANTNHWLWDRFGNVVKTHVTVPDYTTWEDPDTYPMQRVSGMVKNGQSTGIFGTGKLDWHCNLNGPDRADGVALQSIEGVEGTVTSWLNTAQALNDMPNDLIEELSQTYAEYEYAPEIWAAGLPPQQLSAMKKNSNKYKMWIIQENLGGTKGIYFYTLNKCVMVTNNNNLQNTLKDFLFQEKYIYHHAWEVGDIVISDQLLSLHKRQQDDPAILSKRVLNRITFKISNYNNFIIENNKF
jgi:alpha-ketoglutarate-dependent taurine dioxygenase